MKRIHRSLELKVLFDEKVYYIFITNQFYILCGNKTIGLNAQIYNKRVSTAKNTDRN